MESFYVEDDAVSAAFEESWNTDFSLYTSAGEQICNSQCYVSGLSEGVYFAVVEVSGFIQGLAVTSSYDPVDISVLDASGNTLATCFNGEPCNVSRLVPGAYYVPYDLIDGEFSVSVAWEGDQVWTLGNGDIQTGYMGSAGDVFLNSIYISESDDVTNIVQSLGVKSSFGPISTSILDESGEHALAQSCVVYLGWCQELTLLEALLRLTNWMKTSVFQPRGWALSLPPSKTVPYIVQKWFRQARSLFNR